MNSESTLTIPTELVLRIVELSTVGTISPGLTLCPKRNQTLLALSLVHSSWCTMSQMVLRREVSLRSREKMEDWLFSPHDKGQHRTKSLKLAYWTTDDPEHLPKRLIQDMRGLTSLILSGILPAVSVIAVLRAEELRDLESLDLIYVTLEDENSKGEDAQDYDPFHFRLSSLTLNSCSLSSASVKALTSNSLTKLSLDLVEGPTLTSVVEQLPSLSSLLCLRVSAGAVREVFQQVKQLPNLKCINLDYGIGIREAALRISALPASVALGELVVEWDPKMAMFKVEDEILEFCLETILKAPAAEKLDKLCLAASLQEHKGHALGRFVRDRGGKVGWIEF